MGKIAATLLPCALARFGPLRTRRWIIARSSSAKTSIIWNIASPAGVGIDTLLVQTRSGNPIGRSKVEVATETAIRAAQVGVGVGTVQRVAAELKAA